MKITTRPHKLMTGAGILLCFLFSYAPAQAELQCFAPPYTTSVNVQNANQCLAYDANGALFDTALQQWINPRTGQTAAAPGYECVGLPPAYRTAAPGVGGSCLAGYKLGKITRDAAGNITKINYADGSIGYGDGNYTPPPSAPTVTPATPSNPNAFCINGKCTYTPLEPLPGLPQKFTPTSSFADVAGSSVRIFIWLGAAVAIVLLVIGALTYMFSDVVKNKKVALDRIRGAMWGLLLLASSWLILNTINPQLVTFNLKINPLAGVTPVQSTIPSLNALSSAEANALQNSCNARCAPMTGSIQRQIDGTTKCTCATGAVPI